MIVVQGGAAMSPLPLSLFALLSVAACTPVASNEPPPGGEESGESAAGGKPPMKSGPLPPEEQIRVAPGILDESCSAEPAQRFVGRTADEDTVQAAISASGAKTARVIKPDMMVTMDYRGDRLNIRVDAAGKIIEIACG
ncbi:MAG: I78 family peptidase inhibitor [Lysobacteraceae bacterium]